MNVPGLDERVVSSNREKNNLLEASGLEEYPC